MSTEHLYEYAVVRYVPDVEREEFINIGLVMMCKRRGWLRAEFALPSARLAALGPGPAPADLRRHIDAFTRVADGTDPQSPIAALPAHERFRWLTAIRSACLQTSRPHPGLTPDLDVTFTALFSRLVL